MPPSTEGPPKTMESVMVPATPSASPPTEAVLP